MSTSSAVLFEIEGPLARIRFNRPQSRNALDWALAHGLAEAVDVLSDEPRVRVVLLSGAGKSFMAGGDLATFRDAEDRPQTAGALVDLVHTSLAKLHAADFLTVIALTGAVAGAGMSIALSCDFALAADDATFNLAYANVGASPDCGATWALPRLVGLRRALAIALLCPTIDAASARDLGLVLDLVPAAEIDSATEALARRLADGPAEAQALTKRLLRNAFDRTLPEQLALERDAFATCAGTADFAEGLDAFFAGRDPVFG